MIEKIISVSHPSSRQSSSTNAMRALPLASVIAIIFAMPSRDHVNTALASTNESPDDERGGVIGDPLISKFPKLVEWFRRRGGTSEAVIPLLLLFFRSPARQMCACEIYIAMLYCVLNYLEMRVRGDIDISHFRFILSHPFLFPSRRSRRDRIRNRF